MIGDELALTPGIGALEKAYIRLLGVPISGLRIRLRRVLPQLTGNPARVLDAGCGRGVFSFEMAKRFPGADVTGVDIDEQRLAVNREIATRAGLNNLKFRPVDLMNPGALAEEFDGRFDIVLSVDNLEHLEDDALGVALLYRAVKPGGRLILHVPGYERRWPLFRFQTNFDVPGHFRPGYRLADLRALVSQAGFQVDDAWYTFGLLENLSNNLSYAITQAEAKNKAIYALAFPLLNLIAWLGRGAKPEKGAGVLLLARKPVE
ncbi:MAG: class I SAM-dependent methyltransferase [Gammaproteobacteria bacterium]